MQLWMNRNFTLSFISNPFDKLIQKHKLQTPKNALDESPENTHFSNSSRQDKVIENIALNKKFNMRTLK